MVERGRVGGGLNVWAFGLGGLAVLAVTGYAWSVAQPTRTIDVNIAAVTGGCQITLADPADTAVHISVQAGVDRIQWIPQASDYYLITRIDVSSGTPTRGQGQPPNAQFPFSDAVVGGDSNQPPEVMLVPNARRYTYKYDLVALGDQNAVCRLDPKIVIEE